MAKTYGLPIKYGTKKTNYSANDNKKYNKMISNAAKADDSWHVKKIVNTYNGLDNEKIINDIVDSYSDTKKYSVLEKAGIVGLAAGIITSIFAVTGSHYADNKKYTNAINYLGDVLEYNHNVTVKTIEVKDNATTVHTNNTIVMSYQDLLKLKANATAKDNITINSIVTADTGVDITGAVLSNGHTTINKSLENILNTNEVVTLDAKNFTTYANITQWLNASLRHNAAYLNQTKFDLSQDFSANMDLSNVLVNMTKVYANSNVLNNASDYNLARNTLLNMIVNATTTPGNILINTDNNSSMVFRFENANVNGMTNDTYFTGNVSNGSGSGNMEIVNATGNINTHFENTAVSGALIMTGSEFKKFWDNATINGTGKIIMGNGVIDLSIDSIINTQKINDSEQITLLIDNNNTKITGDVVGDIRNFNATGQMNINSFNANITDGRITGTGFNGNITGNAVSETIDLWLSGKLDSQVLTMDNNFKDFMINLMDSYMKMGLAGDAYLQGLSTLNFNVNGGINTNSNITIDDITNQADQQYQNLVVDLSGSITANLNNSRKTNTTSSDTIDYATRLALDAAQVIRTSLLANGTASLYGNLTIGMDGDVKMPDVVVSYNQVSIMNGPVNVKEYENHKFPTGFLTLLSALVTGGVAAYTEKKALKNAKRKQTKSFIEQARDEARQAATEVLISAQDKFANEASLIAPKQYKGIDFAKIEKENEKDLEEFFKENDFSKPIKKKS